MYRWLCRGAPSALPFPLYAVAELVDGLCIESSCVAVSQIRQSLKRVAFLRIPDNLAVAKYISKAL